MLNRLEDEEDQKNILLLSLRQKKQFIRLAPKKKMAAGRYLRMI